MELGLNVFGFALLLSTGKLLSQAIQNFPNSVTIPDGFSGSPSWVQVVDATVRRVQTNDVSGTWFAVRASHVQDDTVPFIGNSNIPYDSPKLDPGKNAPNAFKTYFVTDNFTMWLMFTPDGGHIVPLKKASWYWGGLGILSGSNWILQSSDKGADPTATDTTDYPSWTNKVSNFRTFHPE